MLSLQLKSGEYITIGDNIVVQVFQVGGQFRVAVDAPREVPIVRGEVRERSDQRPDCIHQRKPKSPSQRRRDEQRFKRSAQAD